MTQATMSGFVDGMSSERADAARLRDYYFVRAAVAALWVAAAFTVGRASAPAAAVLLGAYPAWDAAANYADAQRSGGLGRNRSHAFNVLASSLATVGVVAELVRGDLNAVLGVFGAWAILAGLAQLATGVLRWRRVGAQWAMILSGAQSALAGSFFIKQAFDAATPGIATVAPYAAFGAFYFLVSALVLLFGRARHA